MHVASKCVYYRMHVFDVNMYACRKSCILHGCSKAKNFRGPLKAMAISCGYTSSVLHTLLLMGVGGISPTGRKFWKISAIIKIESGSNFSPQYFMLLSHAYLKRVQYS